MSVSAPIRVVVLTARPDRIALDLDVGLPRTGLAPDELRGLPEYAALRAQIGHAVREAASAPSAPSAPFVSEGVTS